MGKSQESFNKQEKEKLRKKKQQEKEARKEERKANAKWGSLEDMIAYVDEFGNITSTPPDPNKKIEVNAEDIAVSVSKHVKEIPEKDRTGRVSFFNDTKGFGFIVDAKNGESVFVHVHGLVDKIKEGDKVSFETVEGMKGLNAVNVKIIK